MKRIKTTTKTNAPQTRTAIAQWLRDCRDRGICVKRVHPACLYIVRSNREVSSHLWMHGCIRPRSQEILA